VLDRQAVIGRMSARAMEVVKVLSDVHHCISASTNHLFAFIEVFS
jgi:hypothetical protein